MDNNYVKKLDKDPLLHMGASVCIPTLNSAGTIGNCLKGLLNQTVLPHEIVICDGGSKDETLKIIEDTIKTSGISTKIMIQKMGSYQLSRKVKLFEGKPNKTVGKYLDVTIIISEKGIGKQRRILAENATREVIAWIDGDILLPLNWLELHLKIHEENEEIKILSGSGKSLYPISQNEKVPDIRCKIEPLPHKWNNMTQGACSMKREIFSVINYDDRFKSQGEDWDLHVSAQRKGIPLHVCEGLIAFHTNKPLKRYIKQIFFADISYGYGFILFLQKYGFWYIKFDPRSFLQFLLRFALIYSLPLSIVFPYVLLIFPVTWLFIFIRWSIIRKNRKRYHALTLLYLFMNGLREHLYLFQLLKNKIF